MEEKKNEQNNQNNDSWSEEEVMNKRQKNQLNPKSRELMKKWFYVGVGVLAIIVTVLLIVLNLPKDSGSNKTEEDTAVADTSSDVAVNTELSTGSVTTSIDGKNITYNGAYVVDGIEATISSGTYESSTDDQVVFLVINGGSLVIDGDVTINKTGSENFQGRGDNYSFYGTNSAIVVVGDDD